MISLRALYTLCQESDNTSLTPSSSNPADLQCKLKKQTNKYSLIGSHGKLANLNYRFGVKIDEHCLERAKNYIQYSLT